MKTTHTVKRIAPGKRAYRGVTMRRDDNTPAGKWGHWRADMYVAGSWVACPVRAGTMARLMYEIDAELDKACR